MPAITSEVRSGETQKVGELEITPTTNLLKIQLPWYHTRLIWNRPRAVVVKTPDGRMSTLPVRDVTRIIIWCMLAGGVLGAILLGIIGRNKKRG